MVPVYSCVVGAVAGQRRRRLRQAVALDDRHARELEEALRHRPLHRHAAAVGSLQAREVELGELRVVQQPVVERVDGGQHVELVLAEFLDEARDVARVGDQQAHGADAHAEQAARGQREDVVERQRRDDRHALHLLALLERGLQPGFVLQHVGDDVAVQQRGALRHAGGAAGVLQEGDVVALDVGLGQLQAPAGRDRVVELGGARQREGRHHLLHLAHHHVDDRALGEAEQIAHARQHDVLHGRLGQHLLQASWRSSR